MFRTFVDETVVHLFSKREVKEEYFDKTNFLEKFDQKGFGVSLNKEGKAVLIEALNETFEKTIKYKGRNIKTKNVIQFECHRIANGLIKKTLINTD
jgi:CRISPR-associated protein Cas1